MLGIRFEAPTRANSREVVSTTMWASRAIAWKMAPARSQSARVNRVMSVAHWGSMAATPLQSGGQSVRFPGGPTPGQATDRAAYLTLNLCPVTLDLAEVGRTQK